MAEQFNVMQSLFGFTPQAVQQQEMQAADTQAMQLARASGSPVAASLFYGLRAANRFGAAPVFGPSQQAQQAGELQTLIQQVQQQGVDLATPEGMTQLAQTLQANPKFTGIGVALSQQAQKMAMESQKAGAEMFQRTAAGYASIAQAGREKEPTKVGVSEEGENVFLRGGRQFTIDAAGNFIPFGGKIREGKGPSLSLTIPQEADLIRQSQTATGDITKRVSSINKALTLNAQNSPFAGAAFKQEVAAVFGDAQKAATEINALANTGALDTRIANRITGFLEGKTTATTKDDRDAVLKVLREQSKDEYERTVTPFRAAVNDDAKAKRLFPSFEDRYGMPKGRKRVIPIPENQRGKFVDGKKYTEGNTTFIVKGTNLVEE